MNYGRDGRMMSLIVKDERPRPADLAKMTDQERAELFWLRLGCRLRAFLPLFARLSKITLLDNPFRFNIIARLRFMHPHFAIR